MPNQPTSHDQQPQPLYYLDNFQRALAWLQQRYSDLLTSAERDFIDQFTALPEPSRALLEYMYLTPLFPDEHLPEYSSDPVYHDR